jgi:hypothetical protein
MVVSGATNRQIAAALFITVDTVKKHLSSVYGVAGCTSRTQLAAARRNDDHPAEDNPSGAAGHCRSLGLLLAAVQHRLGRVRLRMAVADPDRSRSFPLCPA